MCPYRWPPSSNCQGPSSRRWFVPPPTYLDAFPTRNSDKNSTLNTCLQGPPSLLGGTNHLRLQWLPLTLKADHRRRSIDASTQKCSNDNPFHRSHNTRQFKAKESCPYRWHATSNSQGPCCRRWFVPPPTYLDAFPTRNSDKNSTPNTGLQTPPSLLGGTNHLRLQWLP